MDEEKEIVPRERKPGLKEFNSLEEFLKWKEQKKYGVIHSYFRKTPISKKTKLVKAHYRKKQKVKK